MNRSDIVFNSKTSLASRLFLQFGEVFILEAVFLIIITFVNVTFIVPQIILLLVFVFILISKYNKPVFEIAVLYSKRQLVITYSKFIKTERMVIPFEEVDICLSLRLLLNFFTKVVEIRMNNEIIIVLPYNTSFWRKDEMESLIMELKSLAKQELNNDQFNNQLEG